MNAAIYVQAGTGLATVAVAFFVMRTGRRSSSNVDDAAKRAEWWKRTQWAVEMALSDEPRRQTVGVLTLNELLNSPLADEDELNLGASVMDALVPEFDTDDEIDVAPDAGPADGRDDAAGA